MSLDASAGVLKHRRVSYPFLLVVCPRRPDELNRARTSVVSPPTRANGSKLKHAELLVADVSEEKTIKYLDRFLMYYIMTADRLTRTARWLEKMEGGIKYLRKVVVEEYLGIGKELEEHMEQLIGTYQCEWTTVVRDPERRKFFRVREYRGK